jgi:hypothetical protein
LLYGSEAWVGRKKEENRIQPAEMRFLRVEKDLLRKNE